MIRKIGILTALLSFAWGFSQLEEPQPMPSRWVFGGYAGFGGGSGGTSIYLSPRLGYRAAQDLELGVAGDYTYRDGRHYNSSMLGIGPYATYYVGQNFFLHSMLQQYFIHIKAYENINAQETALYLGGGYRYRLGANASMQFGFSYNVLYQPNKSHFGSGFVPYTGVVFGL